MTQPTFTPSPTRFNPSEGLVFIETIDSIESMQIIPEGFNPSEGLVFIETIRCDRSANAHFCFNPSEGLVFIETQEPEPEPQKQREEVSIPQRD